MINLQLQQLFIGATRRDLYAYNSELADEFIRTVDQ